jgi:hypothetical protein
LEAGARWKQQTEPYGRQQAHQQGNILVWTSDLSREHEFVASRAQRLAR